MAKLSTLQHIYMYRYKYRQRDVLIRHCAEELWSESCVGSLQECESQITSVAVVGELGRILGCCTWKDQGSANKQSLITYWCWHWLDRTNSSAETSWETTHAKRYKWENSKFTNWEAQQRYFSYRAILVAIVSQNALVLVFMGIAHLVSRGRCGREIARLRRLAAVVAASCLRFWG